MLGSKRLQQGTENPLNQFCASQVKVWNPEMGECLQTLKVTIFWLNQLSLPWLLYFVSLQSAVHTLGQKLSCHPNSSTVTKFPPFPSRMLAMAWQDNSHSKEMPCMLLEMGHLYTINSLGEHSICLQAPAAIPLQPCTIWKESAATTYRGHLTTDLLVYVREAWDLLSNACDTVNESSTEQHTAQPQKSVFMC